MALLDLYLRHPRMITRDETAQPVFTFAALCHFARQAPTKKLPALIRDLQALIPDTSLSAVRREQCARLAELKKEIAALHRLRAVLAQMTPPSPPYQ
ncbi:hypothetical protein [Martelella alba]|uniref:Uncharacterized protein n=1 Tax=Martelella alba TaxID=2590451 RepID=A0ABY2SLD2_9HYPH|nr:hypothetical protein [Martelella alba]TKI06334.1 hypothetical protein FCN80_10875 [Martelella alba]